jgi:hypothetical protein
MDITTVNDRHLYSATVRMRDPDHPSGWVELLDRVVRFGPPGWLTVADGPGRGHTVQLVPTGQVLAVTHLREVDQPGGPAVG